MLSMTNKSEKHVNKKCRLTANSDQHFFYSKIPLFRPLNDKTGSLFRPLDDKTGSLFRPFNDKTGSLFRPFNDKTGSLFRPLDNTTDSLLRTHTFGRQQQTST